jgi:polysaccharide pyruvyl transferase WcaK-like protein
MPLLQNRSAAAPVPQRIGLLEHMGTGNLGDDATVDAVMQQIKRRWPDAVMIGLSLDPSDTEKRHGIPAYPIRRGFKFDRDLNTFATSRASPKDKMKAALRSNRLLLRVLRTVHRASIEFSNLAIRMPIRVVRELIFLAESFRVAKSLDLLIVCGGGQLLDSWGGPWQFPYTILKWVILAKLQRARCYFVNVGAGPLDSRLSKWFIKRALLLSDYVSFRDANSQYVIQQIGFRCSSQVVADNVYGLTLPAFPIDSRPFGSRSEFVVGIAPMAYCDPRLYWDKDQARYDRYIRTLAQFGAWLIRSQYRLRLLTTDIWFDSQALVDLEAAIKRELPSDITAWITCEPIAGIDELMAQLRQVDCVVTSKFHGVVFAHLMNKPTLALSHHPKVATLMNDLGLSEYHLDIQTFDIGIMRRAFSQLLADADQIKTCMTGTAAGYRMGLANQFDQLFGRSLSRGDVTGKSRRSVSEEVPEAGQECR